MFQSISPYALLRASKPKPPRSVTTAYDLFSLTQTPAADPDACIREDFPPETPPPSRQPAPVPQQAKRTHYIADIHARHASASRRAPQSPGSL